MEWTGGIHGNIRVLALQEGREQGRAEGREQGRAEGRLIGFRQALLLQFKSVFGEVPARLIERLDRAEIETLEAWSLRLVSAKDPMEFC